MSASTEEEIVEVQPVRSSSLSVGGSRHSPNLRPPAFPRSRSSTTILLRSSSRVAPNTGAEIKEIGKEEDKGEASRRSVASRAAGHGKADSAGAPYERNGADDAHTGKLMKTRNADDAHTGKKMKTRNYGGLHRRGMGLGIWRSSLVEMVASLVLTFVSVAAVMACLKADFSFPRIAIAATQFLIYTMCIVAAAPLSGAHLNPSFSFTCILTGHISPIRGLLYILAQSIGSVLGALFVRAAVPSDIAKLYYLGGCLLKQQVLVDANLNLFAWVGADPGPALVAELFFSFLLISVALPLLILHPSPPLKHSTTSAGAAPGQQSITPCHFTSFSDPSLLQAAFIIGLLLGLLIFVSGQLLSPGYTSAGMNPARCFGPAVAEGGAALWRPQWVFWLGPFLAGLLFALLYRVIVYRHDSWAMQSDGADDQWVPSQHGYGANIPQVKSLTVPTTLGDHSLTPAQSNSLQVDDLHSRPNAAAYMTGPNDSATPRRMDVFLHIKATMQKPEEPAVLDQTRISRGNVDVVPVSISAAGSSDQLQTAPAELQAMLDQTMENQQQQVILEHANLSLRNLMELPSTSSNAPLLRLENVLTDTDHGL